MGSLSPQALNNVSLAEEATKRVHSRQCGTVLQRRDLLRLGLVGAGLSHQGRCVAGEVEEAVARSQVQKPVPVGMSILTVKRSVPATTIKDFQRLVGRANQVKIKTKKDLREVYKELRTGKTSGVDLVTIGDAWMTNAIQNKYIQPLADADKYRWYSSLPTRWKNLILRDDKGNPSQTGLVWAAPYRWGCTTIAYREDKLKKTKLTKIEDWSDLMHPSLKNRISFLDSPREFFGVTLKTLGMGYNSSPFELKSQNITEDVLTRRIHDLRDQVLVFSNSEHVRALAAEDAWVVVGSSCDLLPLAGSISGLKVVVPQSGTALWCDMFAACAHSSDSSLGTSPMVNAWLDFLLSPSRAHVNGLQTGVSPLELLDGEGGICGDVDVQLDAKGRFLPNKCLLDRSEFLLPLDPDNLALFMRSMTKS